jgi:beta-lactamase regulating signal transducer with metallopeptidase domain
MSPALQALGWTLVHFLWQGALLGAGVALALWALEGRTCRVRYAVACAGLLLVMAAPPLTFLRLRAEPPGVSRVVIRQSPPASFSREPTPAPLEGRRWAGGIERSLPWVVALWILGTLAMSLRLAGGWVWLQWLRRRPDTHPAPDAEQLTLLRLCERMGVGSNLRLLLCRSVPGPTVLGWLKPVILMPPAMLTGLSPAHLELILAHELAHVLRHDYLVNLLQSVAEVLFFFHPAVWWLSGRIRQEREQASDDLAVNLCGDALEYATALTALEALAAGNRAVHAAPGLALGAQGGNFMFRIHRLISPAAPTLVAPRAGLVVLLLLAGAYGLQARVGAAPTQAEEPLPRGTVLLRRYDADAADGHAKAGTVDMRTTSTTQDCIESAIARLQTLPLNPDQGYVDLVAVAKEATEGGRWTYKFTGVDPARIMTIIRAQAAVASTEKRPGLLRILRINSFTYQGGLLPMGLKVDVWAGDVPADLVLQALNELEAMEPRAGIPQEVLREPAPGTGKGLRVTLDLHAVEPLEVRRILEEVLARSN